MAGAEKRRVDEQLFVEVYKAKKICNAYMC